MEPDMHVTMSEAPRILPQNFSHRVAPESYKEVQ